MRKKELIAKLAKAQCRIRQLEDTICPGGQHEWFADYVEEMYTCKKCKKRVFFDRCILDPDAPYVMFESINMNELL